LIGCTHFQRVVIYVINVRMTSATIKSNWIVDPLVVAPVNGLTRSSVTPHHTPHQSRLKNKTMDWLSRLHRIWGTKSHRKRELWGWVNQCIGWGSESLELRQPSNVTVRYKRLSTAFKHGPMFLILFIIYESSSSESIEILSQISSGWVMFTVRQAPTPKNSWYNVCLSFSEPASYYCTFDITTDVLYCKLFIALCFHDNLVWAVWGWR